MAPIPLNDLRAQHLELGEELEEAARRVVESSRFVGGPDLDAFADEFAQFCGVTWAVPCSSGTDALLLAILGLCGRGDGRREIVTVSFTFAATVEAIVMLGYEPVFVDVEPDTCLMDLQQVEAAITSRTAAIIPVHLYGQMVPIDELCEIAAGHGIPVIEDAAQAHGADWRGIKPGQRSAAATFSFFPGKNLGAWGDAGAVITQDERLANCLAELADHGRTDKHTHGRVGMNARMDNLQAAVLRVKLRYLDRWNEARRRVARWYDTHLSGVPECATPTVRDGAGHVYHQYVVRLDHRDEILNALRADRISFGVHYSKPVHQQPAFAAHGLSSMGPDLSAHDLPVTEALSHRVLSLPMFHHLTQEQVERICGVLQSALKVEGLKVES